MEPAYNSAYIQIEMSNFTFAKQAFTMYLYCTKQVCNWQWSIVAMATMLPHVK